MIGTWEVYCRRERAIALDELQRILVRYSSRPEHGVLVFSVAASEAEIEVTIEQGDDVREAAAELADRDAIVDSGVPAPDLEALRACDVRYLLEYEVEFFDELMNTLIIVAGNLEKACNGIIFDRTADRFA